MRALFKAILATVALAAPLYAHAIPVTWNYSGVCQEGDCAVVPWITGSLTANNGFVTGYSFQLGEYVFEGLTGAGVYFLDGAGNIASGTMLFANFFAFEFLDVGATRWRINDTDCHWFKCSETWAAGYGSYSRVTSIPEPATLSLLGLGLLGFGLARRRRR